MIFSYSRISLYEQCPRRAHYRYIDKLPDPGNKFMHEGTAKHELTYSYISGEIDTFPLNFDVAKIDGLKKIEPQIELALYLDENLEPCDETDKRALLVGKIDILIDHNATLEIIDLKSGRRYDQKHRDQLNFYGVIGSKHYPSAVHSTNQAWYIDQNDILSYQFKPNPIHDQSLLNRIQAFKDERNWDAYPSNFNCKFCPYNKNPCEDGITPTPKQNRRKAKTV